MHIQIYTYTNNDVVYIITLKKLFTKRVTSVTKWRHNAIQLKYYVRVSDLGYEHTDLDLTLIQAWINNHMPSTVWDEITYPFLNFNGRVVDVWERKGYFISISIIDSVITIHAGIKIKPC